MSDTFPYGYAILGLVVGLAIVFAIVSLSSSLMTDKSESQPELNVTGNLNLTSNITKVYGIYVKNNLNWTATFSPSYENITINGEICKEVTCECAKSNPACMSICYHCEDKK